MFLYVLISLVFVSYLELLGQWLLSRLKMNKYPFAFGVGFLFLMAFGYLTTSLISAFGLSFYIIFYIYVIFFLASIVLFFKDRKEIDFKFSIKHWVILIVCVIILMYYSYNTTLGDLHGFDVAFYLNMITSNIGLKALNSRDYFINLNPGYYGFHYTFQSYYYFISCFVFVVKKALSFFGLKVFYTQLIIWVFQVLFDCFFISIALNTIDRFAKKRVLIGYTMLIALVFLLGKQYYNSVYGFFGNTFRQSAIAYCVFFLYDYFESNSKGCKYLFFISLIGTLSFASTNVFIVSIIIFASFFLMVDKEDDLFVWYGICLFIPIIHTIANFKVLNIYVIILSMVFVALLCCFNKWLTLISRKKAFKYIVLFSFAIMTFLLSFKTSGKLIDINSYINTLSESSDMTINYFYINVGSKERIAYCYLVWFLLIGNLLVNHKNKLIMMFWILIFVIFNPFCCSIVNKVVYVYYRAYDIMINPATIIIFSSLLCERINNKYLYYAIAAGCCFLFLINTSIHPNYYHESFIPSDDYNRTMKMTNEEYEIIKAIDEDYKYKKIERPKIVTANLLTFSSIPDGIYTYSRGLLNLFAKNSAAYRVYAIFYPYREYYGEKGQPTNVDNRLAKESLIEYGADYLVIDDRQISYYRETDEYYQLFYTVQDFANNIANYGHYRLYYIEK